MDKGDYCVHQLAVIGEAGMNEVDEAEEKIEVSIKALSDFAEKLKELSNLAWVASESFKKLVKAKEDVEKARKLRRA